MTEFWLKRVDSLRRSGRDQQQVQALVRTIDSIHGGDVRTTGHYETKALGRSPARRSATIIPTRLDKTKGKTDPTYVR
jgi:hypothetical protein